MIPKPYLDKEPNLEEKLLEDSSRAASNQGLLGKLAYHSKNFAVDGVAYAAFYAPVMTAAEYSAGMDWDEIQTTRCIGAVTGFLSGYGISLLRQWWGKTARANTDSSSLAAKKFTAKKIAIDITVGIVTTMPTYAPMLYAAGTSAKEMAVALVIGSGAAAAAGLFYGYASDWWRKRWNLPAVLYK